MANDLKGVVRITRSPLNGERWAIDLACGHEVWLTRNVRPRNVAYVCGRCSDARQKAAPRAR